MKANPESVKSQGPKVEKVISFKGVNYGLVLHMVTHTYPTMTFDIIDRITDREGRDVVGLWQWGTYGRIHIEGLEFDTRSGDKYLQFQPVCRWCNGRKKNGIKYLTGIVHKDDGTPLKSLNG